jgi:malate synthase
MDAILAALRPHVVGLNAGRWDYLFSIIKKFRHRPELLPADRQQIGMTVPFMRAYTELLVQTCHRRGAYAIGGMAAFIPNRRDPEVTRIALEKVEEDKRREAQDGFDGTWVAHPDLVPVAKAAFDAVLGTRSDQRERRREEVAVSAQDLLHFVVPGGRRSREGLEHNVAVAVQYLAHWLAGSGAVALYHLMEDAATAEIARAQVWHWLHNQVRLDDGTRVDRALVEDALERGVRQWGGGLPRLHEAIEVFREVALSSRWVDFVTQAAYPRLLTVQA